MSRGQWLFAIALSFAVDLSPAAVEESPPIDLTVGKRISVAHGTDERFAYRVNCPLQNSCLIVIEQQGIDIEISLSDGFGGTEELNSPLKRDEREIAVVNGAHKNSHIGVQSKEFTSAVGGHSVELAVISPGYLRGWQLLHTGAVAYAAGEGEAAYEAYEAAVEFFRSADRPRETAQALFSLASLEYWVFERWQKSSDLAAEAARAYAELDEPALRSNCLHLQAAAIMEQAGEASRSDLSVRRDRAEELYEQSLRLLETAFQMHAGLGRKYDAASVTNNIGLAHYYRGDWTKARLYWRQAAERFRVIGELTREQQSLMNLQVLSGDDGRFGDAIDDLKRILAILPEDRALRLRADLLDNLGTNQRAFGHVDDALLSFDQAFQIHKELKDRPGGARSLAGTGETYYTIGQLALATTYLKRALGGETDGRAMESILRYLGSIAYLQSRFIDAKEYYDQALMLANTPPMEAHLGTLSARNLRALGRHEEALSAAHHALALAQELDSPRLAAEVLVERGMVHTALGSLRGAERDLNRSLAIYTSLGLQRGISEAHYGLALASHAEADIDKALMHVEMASRAAEAVRDNVANPELRAFYAALKHRFRELEIELHVDKYRQSPTVHAASVDRALEVVERGRARMTLDLLSESAIDLKSGENPRLQARRSDLYEQLAALRYRQELLRRDTADGSLLEDVRQQLASTENAINVVETQLRRENPLYRSLTGRESMSVDQIQQKLDGETVLLQYALSDHASYLWKVSRDRVELFELPPRHEIESAAREVHALLNRSGRTPEIRQKRKEAFQQLSDMALQPAVADLDHARVLVAADGALLYVPFAVLPVDESGGKLIDVAEVVGITSMTVLEAQRNRRVDIAEDRLIAFADPVYQASDRRLAALGVFASGLPETPDDYVRLPSTLDEAEAISKLHPGSSTIVPGFDANLTELMNMDLSVYRYLHFAAHGSVDSRYPSLSAIALSHYDRSGKRLPGELRLHDIYNLELNADLVVLSACETALGREMRGEGLTGLAQGFMYAGANAMVVSLWPVSDKATTALMSKFYENIFGREMAPSAALRETQRWMAAGGRWRDPHYWSTFVLLGEWQ